MVRLIRLRFVPFHFDLADGGPAADPEAKRMVVAAKPALGGKDVHHTPLLLFTPAGELVAEIDSLASEDELFALLARALAEHPSYDAPSEEEREWQWRAREGDRAAACALAQDAFARGSFDEAARGFAALVDTVPPGPERDSAAYELGRVQRQRGDHAAMEQAFARIGDPAPLLDGLRLERARRLLAERRHAELRATLSPYEPVPDAEASPPADPRYPRITEALYLLGVAHFHLGDAERAEALWRALVKRHPEDAWVRRADWAVFELAAARAAGADEARSQLGRAYAGRAHPDLVR